MKNSSIRIVLLSFIILPIGCNNQTQKGVEAPQPEMQKKIRILRILIINQKPMRILTMKLQQSPITHQKQINKASLQMRLSPILLLSTLLKQKSRWIMKQMVRQNPILIYYSAATINIVTV